MYCVSSTQGSEKPFSTSGGGSSEGWEKPTCFSAEVRGSGAAMMFLGGGFFSDECLSCCWPTEPLKKACPFLEPGGVLGKPGEAAGLLSPFRDVSKEDLTALDPFSGRFLPEEPHVLAAEEAELSNVAILSAVGLRVEGRSEATDLLVELKEVRGRGIELLFESSL